MKKAEIIIGVISVLSITLNLLLIPYGGVLTVLALGALSVIYFLSGFAQFNNSGFKTKFINGSFKKISSLRQAESFGTGVALSVTTIGILYKIQLWPGAVFDLIIGVSGLSILTIIGVIRYLRNQDDFDPKKFIRFAMIGGLGLFLLVLPGTTLVEIKFRNHTALRDAMIKSMSNPRDKELRDKVKIERLKLNDNK